MDFFSTILAIIGILIIGIGFIIGAFMLHWVFGIITTGLVVLGFAAILYEAWLES